MTDKQTNRQTDKQTYGHLLKERMGPEGRFFENQDLISSRYHGSGSRDQASTVINRDQGTRIREQGTGNREL